MGRRTSSLQHDLVGLQSLNQITNVNTQRQYKKELRKFAFFCKDNLSINKFHKLESYGFQKGIQAYTNHLIEKGRTPNTIHTKVAAICRALGVPMDAIDKPLRKSSTIIRSRVASKNKQGDMERENPKYEGLVAFQEKVGLRRNELKRLKGNSLKVDESGYLCVEVEKGKNGKYQLQRIAKEDEDFIIHYFNGTKDKVFTTQEMKNKIDLHLMRAKNAQAKYKAYQAQCKDPEFELQLRRECVMRYKTYHGKRPNETSSAYNMRADAFVDSLFGTYTLRGDNRIIAETKGYPVTYDRLCLMAVSIFHLSHWRLNVTVTNYMLH